MEFFSNDFEGRGETKTKRDIFSLHEDQFLLFNKKTKNSDRLSHKLIGRFLGAMLEDKLSIDSLINTEMMNKINKSLFAQGMSFDEIDGNLKIDSELDSLFGENMKNIIISNFKGM